MMLALILAQLVLPWPGLDSPLVQPGPTICVGECAGPMVWGPAERGRLVVACDMTSDTCSDGRKITTTRATPVPCEVAPGVWEMVPEDTACISVRGLESWAQNTSYLSWGAELDRSPWIRQVGISVEEASAAWRIGNAAGVLRFLTQELPAQAETSLWTASCILRKGNVSTVRLSARRSGTAGTFELTDDWAIYSHTTTVAAGQIPGVSVGTNGETEEDFFYSAGCWLTKTATPGRPCWGGEAPVTCAADQHTISTEGWPTTHGSIEVVFRIDEAPKQFAIILDSRSGSNTGFNIHYESATGRLNHRQNDQILSGPTITLGTWYRVRLERDGGYVRMYVNGVLGAAESDWPAWSYLHQSGVALLGKHAFVDDFYVNGPIRSLTVRSYEEVSP